MPSPPQIVTTDLDGPHQVEDDVNLSPRTPVDQGGATQPTHLSPSAGQTGVTTPSSPTLTTSTVHFKEDGSPVSLAVSGAPTGNTLAVPDSPSKSKRKWSIGTWSSTGKDRDLSATDDSATDSDSDADGKKKKKKKKGKKNEEELVSHLDPSKDTTDPTPFAEKPSTLAMLVDPKSLDDLEKIGGVQGLLNGLGVDPSRGLPTESGHDGGAPRSSSELRAIDGGDGAQWTASYEQRRKVYGRNDLPERKSKSIWALMWDAFKDKVLVRNPIHLPWTDVSRSSLV